jgi:tetratricopeptide (TPR) repeat protein
MVAEVAAKHELSQEIVDGVSERTGGVPLFIEEVTRLLLERGTQGGAQAIPLTLQQSLSARLDRLGAAREVAMIGAVLGRGFSYPLLKGIAGMDDSPLQQALKQLAEADILLVEGPPPQANYRFKHALIQDAAYENLLKSRRQALHRRAAETLHDVFPERAAAQPEALAHHFTEGGLTEAAIEWWGKAGDQALQRSAFPEAIAHLGKAIEMADTGAGEANAAAPTDQRLKLQTSYGLAMAWSKGFTAEETKAVLAQTLGLVALSDNIAERMTAYYALWVALFVGGELKAAHEAAEGFLGDAKLAGDAPAQASAARALGLTCLFQGRFADAREHGREALRVYSPSWEVSARRLHGFDAGIAAKALLAWVAWHFGDATGAAAQFEEALTEALASEHAPTIAGTSWYRGFHEMVRGDAEATLRSANVVLDVSEKNSLRQFESLARMCLDWARARNGEADGLARFLGHGETFISQGGGYVAPLFYGLFAELEAERTSVEEALTSIDRAIDLAREGDIRYLDSWLHRIRGDILRKAHPDDPAPAEEAYLAAVTVARDQGARSFGLLGALKLAKLHQSTGRPIEAHDILASALEGFVPTPEMPEIAEAQSLVTALADAGGQRSP